jgi:hypothetical protein
MVRRRKDTTMARRNMTKGKTLQWQEETWLKERHYND